MANVTTNILVPNATIAGLEDSQSVTIADSANPVFATATLTGLLFESTKDAITALAGGAQAGTALTAMINRVTTVATGGDSVQLPTSTPGTSLTIVNAAAANSMNVFPQTGDAINALTANTAFAIVAGKAADFYCTAAGRWHVVLSA